MIGTVVSSASFRCGAGMGRRLKKITYFVRVFLCVFIVIQSVKPAANISEISKENAVAKDTENF